MNSERSNAWLTPGIALLAAFLGGATSPWAKATVMILIGGIIMMKPPGSFGDRRIAFGLLGLLILGLSTLLPAGITNQGPWREQLVAAGFQLPATVSPQPWLTFEGWWLLAAGILWWLWLLDKPWSPDDCRAIAGLLSLGISILAIVSLIEASTTFKIPFWHSGSGFGPFPNRNQSGILFAIGGVLCAAFAAEELRAGRKRGLWWLAGLVAIMVAIDLAASRAAFLFFFGGLAVLLCLAFALSKSVKMAALGAGVVLLFLSVFLVANGKSIERLRAEWFLAPASPVDFRALVHQDAMRLIQATPWSGIGLGNFAAVFPLSQQVSGTPARAIHPESDWLWLWAEMGWSAVLVALWTLGWMVRGMFGSRDWNMVRAGTAIAALCFALHGLIDVSGHRLGTILSALLMLALAMGEQASPNTNRRAKWIFRCTGFALMCAGLGWLVGWQTASMFPSSGAVMTLKGRAEKEVRDGQFAAASDDVARGLRWAPLDWELYYLSGLANAGGSQWIAALSDFKKANVLEPHSPLVPFEEGKVLLQQDPLLALSPWREALTRATPSVAADYYSHMMTYAARDPRLRRPLYEMAADNFDLLVIFLGHADREEFRTALERVLRADPGLELLTAAQREILFKLCQEKGSAEELGRLLDRNPQWQTVHWRFFADREAAAGRFQEAWEIALKNFPPPKVPPAPEARPDFERSFLVNSSDFVAGYGLYAQRLVAGDMEGAAAILARMTRKDGCPAYLQWLEARLYADRQEWQPAWEALKKYLAR